MVRCPAHGTRFELHVAGSSKRKQRHREGMIELRKERLLGDGMQHSLGLAEDIVDVKYDLPGLGLKVVCEENLNVRLKIRKEQVRPFFPAQCEMNFESPHACF